MTSSLPAHLLRAPGSKPGTPPRGRGYAAPARAGSAGASGSGSEAGTAPPAVGLTAAPGIPGGYTPELAADQRPRNIGELTERVQPATVEPWPVGTYVLIGTSGKRAHWTGSHWKGGESPGYRSTVTIGDAPATAQELSTRSESERSETEQTDPSEDPDSEEYDPR